LEQIETFISNTFEHSETFFKNFLVIWYRVNLNELLCSV
jgi:hypothetical protein